MKLIEEGSELIKESPARVMFVSKDHSFADYSNVVADSGVELILMQTGGASQKWFDNASKFLTINLFNIQCQEQACQERFSLEEEMLEHFEKKHVTNDKGFTCEICKKPFPTERGMNDHKGKVHPVTIECSKCNKSFGSKDALEQHKKVKGH